MGFASLQMNKAVGIDPKTYGLGAGIFFLGYFILEVPSNLVLERFGARTWIARIMLTWGAVSAAFALIGGPISFLAMIGTLYVINNLWLMMGLLTLIASGTYASEGPFWALSSEWLGPTVAAAGLAQINALGNLSGFLFNYMIGWIKDETGSFPMALMPIAAVATIGVICVITLGRNQPRTVPVPA